MNRQLEILQQCTEDGDAWTQEQLTKFDAHELPVESQKCCTPYVQQLKARAEEGNAEAQFLLGWEYANGEVRNYKTAAEWFRKAAEQGNAPAQRELGCMYYDGDGVAQDFEQLLLGGRKQQKQETVMLWGIWVIITSTTRRKPRIMLPS